MAKIALITDLHYGARSDNVLFLDYQKKFLEEVFFPYVDEHDIKYLMFLGDLVERRKYVNYYTASRLREDFLDQINARDLDVSILGGNHDEYYKDTYRINALRELVDGAYPFFKIYMEAAEVKIEGVPILLVPWINQENREHTLELIKKTKAQICFGHLDLNGFEMNRGAVQTDGDDPGLFGGFDIVCSGHFHHPSSRGNIHYLGAPLQFTWNDYNDRRGFHIFDTSTRQLDFIENPYVIFKKIFYNDKEKTADEVIHKFEFDKYAGCFCKVIVQEKVNPFWFDMFIENLEREGLSDLQIVEDHHNFDMEGDDDLVSAAEDTLTIFKNFIEQMEDENIDKPALINSVMEIYEEALAME